MAVPCASFLSSILQLTASIEALDDSGGPGSGGTFPLSSISLFKRALNDSSFLDHSFEVSMACLAWALILARNRISGWFRLWGFGWLLLGSRGIKDFRVSGLRFWWGIGIRVESPTGGRGRGTVIVIFVLDMYEQIYRIKDLINSYLFAETLKLHDINIFTHRTTINCGHIGWASFVRRPTSLL